jgi:tetratricopeptide (TPR) repeat protein
MNRLDVFGAGLAAWPRSAFLAFVLISLSAGQLGAQPGSPASTAGRGDETNSQETLRSYLQLQEQIHATQLAVERSRTQAEAAATETAKTFAARLQGIETALASQRAQELEAMQSSNKVMLIVAGLFAGLGLLAMLFMAYFQWRTINRLAEISAALPLAHALGSGPVVGALGAGDPHLVTIGPPEQSNQRLLGALERLEKRIHELEHTAHEPLNEGASLDQQLKTPPPPPNGEPAAAAPEEAPVATDAARITVLLGKGQSLLNLDQAEEALGCFDQILALDPSHPEALVKKGAALERLRKLDEAIACYDRAIAADGSLTVAYLYKGGLFNRMERFSEALECYEQALHTQEARRG